MRAGWSVAFACSLLMAVAGAGAQQQPLPPPPSPPSQMPAAISVPNPFAGTHPSPVDLYRSPDGSDRFTHGAQYPPPAPTPVPIFPGGYYPGPYYLPSYYSPYPQMPLGYMTPVRPRIARGRLTLETLPESAQVYVDGFYVGLAEEFGFRGRALELSAGSHQVELRSPEHETLSFSVMITADETVRYRGDMRRLSVAAIAPTPNAARKPQSTSVYVIPKCYAGDKPPAQPLPVGCDRRKLQTHK